jgi:Partial alpha/beta-hydrolase lipase region
MGYAFDEENVYTKDTFTLNINKLQEENSNP